MHTINKYKHSKFEKIAIASQQGYELVSFYDILYLEAANTYTIFYFIDGSKLISTRNLGFYEQELIAEAFFRVHQSYIVNLNMVKSYIKADDGYVVMVTGKTIKVSRSKKEDLVDFFKLQKQNSVSK